MQAGFLWGGFEYLEEITQEREEHSDCYGNEIKNKCDFAKIKIGDIASGSAYHRTIYQ